MRADPAMAIVAMAIVALVTVCASGCATLPASVATPQRPSFSADTSTTAAKTLEVEAGVALADDDSVDSPVTLKWGANSSTELFVGISPYRRADFGAASTQGVGDANLGARLRVSEEDEGRPSVAIQGAVKIPLASDEDGLGSGEVDAFAAGILTRTLGRTTAVGFYQLGFVGDPGDSGMDVEHGSALAVGHPLVQNLSGFVELAAVFLPAHDVTNLFTTLGVGYSLQANVVLDAAMALGLSDDAGDWNATLGVTANLGPPGP